MNAQAKAIDGEASKNNDSTGRRWAPAPATDEQESKWSISMFSAGCF
jgi:hypothetical protein